MKSCEIKAARVRLKYTQKYMAERLGIATGTYQKKENGAIRFTDQEKVQVTKILGLTAGQMNDFLFDGILPIGNKNECVGNNYS